MDRREMLRYTALLTGGAVSGSFASAFLTGCSQPTSNSDLYFFESDQFDLLTQIVDTILPRTDSPSATDLDVHHTVDSMLGLVFDEDFKSMFVDQWTALESYLGSQNFEHQAQSSRVQVLSDLQFSSEEQLAVAKRGFRELKQQIIAYYLNTEEIGTKFLNYMPIPGSYDPCIPLEDVNNKAWAE